MKKEILYGGAGFLLVVGLFFGGKHLFFDGLSADLTTQQNAQGITLPETLASGDIISSIEWNKIRTALLDLDNRTSEINLSNDGQMGVGLNGLTPDADVHIKGTTYADATILLEDGEANSHKWVIGGGETYSVSRKTDIVKENGEGGDEEEELDTGFSITHDLLRIGLRTNDPKAPLHFLKGDSIGSQKEYPGAVTSVIENAIAERTTDFPLEEDRENNFLAFSTHDKRADAGVRFETAENDGWHGIMKFSNETKHTKFHDFDIDSLEKYLMLSASAFPNFENVISHSVFINEKGNMGVGTDKPFHSLHIIDSPSLVVEQVLDPRFEENTSFVSETKRGNANIGMAVNGTSEKSLIQFSNKDLEDSEMSFQGGENSPWDGVIKYVHGQDYMQFSTDGKQQNHALTLNKQQFLGIGTDINDLAFKLHVIRYKQSPYGDDILGMFEFASTGASAYAAANTNDMDKKSGFVIQGGGDTKARLFHDHKENVLQLRKNKAGFLSVNPKGFFGIQHGEKEDDAKHRLHIRECPISSEEREEEAQEGIDSAQDSVDAISDTSSDEYSDAVTALNDAKTNLESVKNSNDSASQRQDSQDKGDSIECKGPSEQNVMVAIESKKEPKAYFGAGASEKVGIKFVANELKEEWKGLIEYDNTKNKLSFGTNAENHRMDIDEKGWVGINKEDPEHGVHFVPKDGIMKVEGKVGVNKDPAFDVDAPSVNGDQLCVAADCIGAWLDLEKYFALKDHEHGGYADAGHDHGESSDKRMKKNIIPLGNVLEKISQINGVFYNWRPFTGKGDRTEIGVIAQEVEAVFPELVGEDNNGFKTVQYSHLTAILLEGVKQQQSEIVTLEKRLEILEQKLENL